MKTRGWLIGGALGALVLGVAVVSSTGNGDGDIGADPDLEFEAVETRDLQEVVTLDGTLGFPTAESIASRLGGTITAVVESGSVLAEGDILYQVDGEPVAFLLGSTPAFRDLGETPVESIVAAGRPGTVTSLPDSGAVVTFDEELFRVDDAPAILLPGDTPAWRALRRNSEGSDVAQLEAALVGLGYDPDVTLDVDDLYTSNTGLMVERWQEANGLEVDGRFSLGDAIFHQSPVTVLDTRVAVGDTVGATTPILTLQVGSEPLEGDDVLQLQQALERLGYAVPTSGTFDAATTAAVVQWQIDIGAEADGVVHLGEVAFLPEPIRVTEALLTVGRPVGNGTAVLATSDLASVVLVDLPAADQELLTGGIQVDVEMPDGSIEPAVVTDIAGIATRTSTGDVVFETTIELLDSGVGTDLDQAPVDVLVVTDERTQVLAVPVTALLALAEGGYAVEVDRGAATSLVRVEPGLYADGWVEIGADGIVAGDLVVVP